MALLNGLVAHWAMDADSGNEASSLNGHTLTANGGAIGTATGLISPTSRNLVAASSQFFSAADGPAYSMGDVPFAIGGHFKAATLPAAMTLAYKGDVGSLEFQVFTINSQLRFRVASGAGFAGMVTVSCTSVVLATGTWYTFMAWHDPVANTLNLQVNNGTAHSAAYSVGSYNSTLPLGIGGYTGAAFFNGQLEGMAIWRDVFPDAADRTRFHNNGLGIPFSGFAGGPRAGTLALVGVGR